MKAKEKVECPLCGGDMKLCVGEERSGWFCQNNASHIMTLSEYSDLYFGMRGRGPNLEKLPSVIENIKERAETILKKNLF